MTGSVRQSLVRIITFDAGSVLIILGAHVDYYVVKCTVTDVQLQFWTNKSPCRIHNNPPGFLGQSLTLFDALLLFGELRFEDGARERGGVLHDGLRLAQRVPRAARPDRLHQQLLRRRVLPRRRQLPPRSLQAICMGRVTWLGAGWATVEDKQNPFFALPESLPPPTTASLNYATHRL